MGEISAIVAAQQRFFDSGATRAVEFRQEALRRLLAALEEHEERLLAALWSDLRKHAQEAFASELGLVRTEIRHALRRLPRWTRPRRAGTPLMAWPGKSRVVPEPFGRALIIGAWNYPLHLLLTPCVSAVAAGNCCVLKPSELAPHTAEAVAAVVRSAFAPEHVALVQGDAAVAQGLLELRHDKIFFTGSTAVGRKVMAAAAQHLTPVALELGGKCPCVVTRHAALRTAARRIAWGKFINAGQTCLAPDYILVETAVKEELVRELQAAITVFYGTDPQTSPHYGRIINDRHFQRLTGYLAPGKIAAGGGSDAGERYIAPTLLLDPPPDSPVMTEEIFGPLLPLVTVGSFDEALAFIRARPTPLAAYLFSEDAAEQSRMVHKTRSGGLCLNDTVLHAAGHALPFGGLGASGMGSYRGKTGFDAFSHQRAVMTRSTRFDNAMRYPPPRLSLQKLKRFWDLLLNS